MQRYCKYIIFCNSDAKKSIKYNGFSDKISVGVSLACAVHCVLLPLIFTTLPFFGIELMKNIFIESATVSISLLIGGWAIMNGYRKHHRNKIIPVLFAFGITLLATGNLVHSKILEISLMFSGASLLITAHILNWKKCQNCTLTNSAVNN